MSSSISAADHRTRAFFGGPGIGALALLLVAAVGIPLLVSAAGWSTFTAAAAIFTTAVIAVSVAAYIRRGAVRAGIVAAAGAVAVLILFLVGYTGIFSMSSEFRWSGLSAVTGIVLGSLTMGAVLRRVETAR